MISQKDSTVKFANKLPHNEVIRILAKYPVEKVLIEEPSLEDLFLHYYEEDK